MWPWLCVTDWIFKEWDGLTRVAFQRKNKTLSACFKSKVTELVIERIWIDSMHE